MPLVTPQSLLQQVQSLVAFDAATPIVEVTKWTFSVNTKDWGFTTFMPVHDLYDPGKGFIMNDACIIEADVTVRETEVTGKRKRNNTPSKIHTRSVEYGENLVGSRIKIWNPEDKIYCHGVVKSFDSRNKEHKLLYDDGVVELFNLKREKWEPVKNVFYKSDRLKQSLPEKASSPQSDIICVQGYKVKTNIAPILEAIFKKHGDIVANCVFKPASMREAFLEAVCEAVTRIETSDFTTIISKMEEIDSQVSVLEAAKCNVSWLRARLEDILRRKKAKENSIMLMETKTNTVLVKRAAQMDLKEGRAALVDAQELFQKAEKCVRVLDLVENKVSKNILQSEAEKDSWVKLKHSIF